MPDAETTAETQQTLEIAINNYVTARSGEGFVGDWSMIAEHVAQDGTRNVVVWNSPTMTPWKLSGLADYGHSLLKALVAKMHNATMRQIYGEL